MTVKRYTFPAQVTPGPAANGGSAAAPFRIRRLLLPSGKFGYFQLITCTTVRQYCLAEPRWPVT